MDDTMTHMLPILFQRLIQLSQDPSEASCLLQKQILKIFYAYTQNYLPLSVLTKEIFTRWMKAIRLIVDTDLPPETNQVDKDLPPETNQVDEEDRPELACWKLKKWGVRILARLFERYGSPGNVIKEYTEFSEWYLKTFSCGVLNVLLKQLEGYRQKMFVAPRVLQQTLNYINQGISHAFSWKFIKPHIQVALFLREEAGSSLNPDWGVGFPQETQAYSQTDHDLAMRLQAEEDRKAEQHRQAAAAQTAQSDVQQAEAQRRRSDRGGDSREKDEKSLTDL